MLEELCSFDRETASPGERAAAEWLVERLRAEGAADARIEEERGHHTFWWPLGLLNDSKQCTAEQREELFHGVLGCAERIEVRVIPQGQIDRNGLHKSNLAAMRSILHSLSPPAEACLVDGFKLGPTAPPHRAVVDGDEKSAAIAAASIVAKVTRDRVMRRMDALFPHYGFSSHVGYITPGHSAIVRARGPSRIHRRSFQALCYLSEEEAAAIRAARLRDESAAPVAVGS